MTTTLTDTERTLLSALRDGELSGAERARAEQMLERSEAARDYVRDLQSLAEFSRAAFPVPPAISIGAVAGKLTAGAITTAARSAARSTMGMTWGLVGVAAAAVTTVAVLSTTLDRTAAPAHRPPHVAATSAADLPTPNLDVNAAALMVPPITSAELIDFAVSGRLPIDSGRSRYVSVAPDMGTLAINVHGHPGTVPARLGKIDLRAVPGIDSIERAIRTSLLQSHGDGLAVSCDLPSLRLRVLAELQEVADELPAEIRRSIDGTRTELEGQCRRLGIALGGSPGGSSGSARRGDAPARYVLVSGAELPKPGVSGSSAGAFRISTSGGRFRTLELSSADRGSLEALVAASHTDAADRPVSVHARFAAAVPSRVLIRRPSAARGAVVPMPASPSVAQDSTITFEQIQILRQRGETLDGIYINSEVFIDRANRILQRADSIRQHIESIRRQQLELPDSDPESIDGSDAPVDNDGR